MGCDIHMFVEKKKKDKWEFHESLTLPRNYELFAMLADVRNRYEINPISEERGLPKDISEEGKKYISDNPWGYYGGHSYSYFNLKELIKYNWKQTIKIVKSVDLKNYKEWIDKDRIDRPYEYCTCAFGGRTIYVSNSDMEILISLNEDFNLRFYTEVEWNETYAQASSPFYEEVIPKLKDLSSHYGGDGNVRIVFFFDN